MITVTVPATSANLGPGFDVLGLALPLYNRLTLAPATALRIRHTGPEAAGLPEDPTHLAYRAAEMLCETIEEPVPVWELAMEVHVPQSRGLGSSSSAIVAGLVAANAWFGDRLTREELLTLATRIEGHPDNVAPALYGGVTAAWTRDGVTQCLPLNDRVPASLVLAVPNFHLSTSESRRALPDTYTRADVVENLAAVTILTTVMLKNTVECWADGLFDRLHQPYRFPLIPGAEAVARGARHAGAYGTVISGAGPTLLAFCPEERQAAVALAMVEAWSAAKIESRALTFDALATGAWVESTRRGV
ncbi:MAG TPA: homoserine kinase [Oscillatoriaceae cyanobacterium]